jgi:hypothetical protein
MGTHVILGFAALMQASATPQPAPTPPSPPSTKASPQVNVAAPAPTRCDARPWQRLVGRTISDLLTVKLPEGTRIYRIDDPPGQAIASGRLSVELNRSTRVRRVYCS